MSEPYNIQCRWLQRIIVDSIAPAITWAKLSTNDSIYDRENCDAMIFDIDVAPLDSYLSMSTMNNPPPIAWIHSGSLSKISLYFYEEMTPVLLSKHDDHKEWVEGLSKLRTGEKYVSTTAAEKLFATKIASSEPLDLSRKEIGVLVGHAKDLKTGQIADILNISPNTVNTYRHRVREKYKLDSQLKFAQFLLKIGLRPEG